MSKQKELEDKRDAIQKEIDKLKKSTGQLRFEDLMRDYCHASTFHSSGRYSLEFPCFDLSVIPQGDFNYKQMVIAIEALLELTNPSVECNL